MSDEKEIPQIIGNFLFLKLFHAFRMAVQPSKLTIAFLALVVICLSGWVMDLNRTVVAGTNSTELDVYINSPDQLESYLKDQPKNRYKKGVFSTLWRFNTDRLQDAVNSVFLLKPSGVITNIAKCFRAMMWAVRCHFIYSVVFFTIMLAMVSIAGGSLCRITALQLAHGEKPGLTEALGFGTKKFFSFFAAPLIPVGIIVFIGAFLFLSGLICNLPWIGEILTAISMPLVLIGGALIATIGIGTIGGFNLMFPAVAYDGSDCFDAINRSFNYAFAKPWCMIFYTTTAFIYGAVCYTFVRLFAFLLLAAARLFLQLGVFTDNSTESLNKIDAIWPTPNFMNMVGSKVVLEANWSESISGFIVHLSVLAVVGLVASFVMSFYFSANTIIYGLLRNQVDETPIEDVYIYLENNEFVNTEPASNQSDSDQTPAVSEDQG